MRISRRSLLIAGAIVLVPGAPLLRGGARSHFEDLLTAHFGPVIADHPETRKFLDAYGEMLGAELPFGTRAMTDLYFNYEIDRIELSSALEDLIEEHLIYAFLTSTNALVALEGKEPLEFSGLFDPYVAPCRNRLATTV
jgi:hypothetical protein